MNEASVLEKPPTVTPTVFIPPHAGDCCVWDKISGIVTFLRHCADIPLKHADLGMQQRYNDENSFTHDVRMFCIHRASWNAGKQWREGEESRFLSHKQWDGRYLSLVLITI